MPHLSKSFGISGGREDRELIPSNNAGFPLRYNIDDWGRKRLISRLVIDIMVFSSEEGIWPIFL